ncbi:hypothetical protein GUJ93_ZPchr0005g15083 [Zizania palustris]|uniref:Uncharacterized protein n=1 Tax=Zizania palustris TaxID=103762 RepID=A0A8J5VI41_ZIZPA|nr:hypothetical protein GUJ93_ZPchr0005g15083 [Zizania palustris]
MEGRLEVLENLNPGHGPLPAATEQGDDPPRMRAGGHQEGGRQNPSQADDEENDGQGDSPPHHQGGGRLNPCRADDDSDQRGLPSCHQGGWRLHPRRADDDGGQGYSPLHHQEGGG